MKEMQRMIEEIEEEVRLTRSYIGKDALNPSVMKAMAEVSRDEFVPEPIKYAAYYNGPQPIGFGQTISQPYIVALMTDMLEPKPDDTILEIGTGSAYQAAVLARLVKQVYTVEIIGALAELAEQRLKRLGYDNVEAKTGDGYEGWIEHAPYDGIIVTAAAPAIPEPLIEQLKIGGRLVIPVGHPGMTQDLLLVEKGDELTIKNVLPVAFVPLTRHEDRRHAMV